MKSQKNIGAVVIGRNEGDRLINCLTSLKDQVDLIVYVDSGSSDDSVENAKRLGADCVLLDPKIPFTAARARNAGFERVMDRPDPPELVQFLDGDCRLEAGYLSLAAAEFETNDTLAVVTGWRAEIYPKASVYNDMCDHEWHGPVGDILACGGDMMVRAIAFKEVGGFNPTVIAAEDDEFCTRLRKAGWTLRRLPVSMTHHDANMMQFSQWWSRAVRTGHGFEQVHDLHPDYFQKERKRMWFYGAVLPVFGIIGALFFWPLLIVVLAIFALSYLRTVRGLRQTGMPRLRAAHHGFYLFLSKFPNIIGATTYHRRKRKGAEMEIIEYK
ncbi:glycosyltransferase [Sulfitobacter geojensis]|uniref:glycosyltransferase n=1 Tax=Sulfitobacter geojensis TaxID=1342299 RepID=UPI003B8D6CD4